MRVRIGNRHSTYLFLDEKKSLVLLPIALNRRPQLLLLAAFIVRMSKQTSKIA
ncbi:hypothetical protein C5S53_01360 [Methanophagales archaeon]|jgi:hypothetical protein|nr:hypothetical protein C5S53_01360 [Methanophagales archaeon]